MVKVLQFVEGLSQGGIEAFVTNVARNINKEDVICDFLVLKTEEAAHADYVYEKQLLAEGCRIYYLINYDTSFLRTLQRAKGYIQALKEWLQEREYDIIHIHASHLGNFFPMIRTMEKCGVQHIFLHSHSTKIQSTKMFLLHQIFRKLLYFDKKVTRLACGEDAGRWMYGKQSFEIIKNGIELDRFRYLEENRISIKRELCIPEKTQIIGHIGAFRKEKNHFYLLNVFKLYCEKHPNSILLLVGDGTLKKQIVSKVNDLGLKEKVLFLGNRSDVNKILSAIDCVLLPSLFEGISLAAIETQANGVPMIISDGVARQTILCNKVSVCSIEETEMAYTKWCDTIEKVIYEGRKGIDYKEEFKTYDIRRTVRKLEALYKGCIENKI